MPEDPSPLGPSLHPELSRTRTSVENVFSFVENSQQTRHLGVDSVENSRAMFLARNVLAVTDSSVKRFPGSSAERSTKLESPKRARAE